MRNTPILGLLLAEEADKATTKFNITTMLNENWEKVEEGIDSKVDKVVGKGLSEENFTSDLLSKLNGIDANANKYTHPDAHSASVITTDSSRRWITDALLTKLSGIDAGAEVNLAGAELVTLLNEQSGLCADKADKLIEILLSSSDDLNNVVTNGLYHWTSSVPVNIPTGGMQYMNMLVTEATGQPVQMIFGGSTYGKLFVRRRDNGSWYPWTEFWSDGNMGAGSGLNADKLDGKHGTEYKNSVATANSSADPNITTEALILTNHINGPDPLWYWHVNTSFYSSVTGNASQVAVSYNRTPALMYIRHRYSGTWSPWIKMHSAATITSGTAAPSGGLDGDIYLQYD